MVKEKTPPVRKRFLRASLIIITILEYTRILTELQL
jgi:hypothetical protein